METKDEKERGLHLVHVIVGAMRMFPSRGVPRQKQAKVPLCVCLDYVAVCTLFSLLLHHGERTSPSTPKQLRWPPQRKH